MTSNKRDLLLLFDRPQEPVFIGKGHEGKTVFDVPHHFLTERYRPIATELTNRFGETAEKKIPVNNISIPDLSIPMQLERQAQFSLFIPVHRRYAGRLIDVFTGVRNVEDLKSVAAYARDRINPLLFNYAFSVALLHRQDTKDLDFPTLVGLFPEKYIDSKVFAQIREESNIVTPGDRMPIEIPIDYTASDLEEEHRLWYFREDMGINLHHWHWHLVYPFEAGDRSIVAKDRRGELFYYMHQQLIARYNFERLCNNLGRVKRLNDLDEPIAEAYFPKMDSLVASRAWPARAANTKISDLNREVDQIKLDKADLMRWRDRIFEAIHQGFCVDEQGNRIALDEATGIDTLGNIIESSTISPNRNLYGDFHNMCHVFISYAHDPDHRHLESFGVMGDTSTAMRDPVFYRLHAFVDDIFQEHKERLTPYTTAQLGFDGVVVQGVTVETEGSANNTFQTHWQRSDINLSRGMDFTPRGNVFARITHLQHIPYRFTLQISNSGAPRLGTVRIYMSPKNDERGTEMLFRDQRLIFTELDKFVVQLNSGVNTIRRKSTDSTVTIPFERTFRDLDENRPAAGTPAEAQFNFCGCGWPQHMLIPRGTPEGFPCDLFVMVTNYEDDKIEQELAGTCNDAAGYCGVRDRLYPDKKPMGFPFDRLPRRGAERLATFVPRNSNMFTITCNVVHTNRTTTRAQPQLQQSQQTQQQTTST